MNVLSLFSGIGGLDLGLERAGHTIVGQVEVNEYCQRVLRKNWPDTPLHDDVRTCATWWRSQDRPEAHALAGGFPCQPHSVAGRKRGSEDPRYGWGWFYDVIRELEPGYVLVENVPNLVNTGLRTVLSDLDALGFTAWWSRVPAAALGAPHLRWRLFVLAAHPDRTTVWEQPRWWSRAGRASTSFIGFDGAAWDVAYPYGEARGHEGEPIVRGCEAAHGNTLQPRRCGCGLGWGAWAVEPPVDRVAHGVSAGMDRRRTLGNAVVPAVGEYVGHMLNSIA